MDEGRQRFFFLWGISPNEHPPQQKKVTASINKLKSRHLQARLTIEDLSAVVNMEYLIAEGEQYSEDESDVRWIED